MKCLTCNHSIAVHSRVGCNISGCACKTPVSIEDANTALVQEANGSICYHCGHEDTSHGVDKICREEGCGCHHFASVTDQIKKPSPVSVLPPSERSGFAKRVEEIKRDMDYQLEFVVVQARVRRKAYLAYIDEGFTPAQALELCVK
jgi:hypothetical protein